METSTQTVWLVLSPWVAAFARSYIAKAEKSIILNIDCESVVDHLIEPPEVFGEWILVAEAMLRELLKANREIIAVRFISNDELQRGIEHWKSHLGPKGASSQDTSKSFSIETAE